MMASNHRRSNDVHEEGFAESFHEWLDQQERDLHALRSAIELWRPHGRLHNGELAEEERRLQPLLDCVIRHYEEYYRAKSASAEHDVLPMFSPSWTSTTENLFLWVGGWRPSMAFHLLYSKSGLQVESQLAQIVNGITTGDLADISRDQLDRIDSLHRETVRREREISEEAAAVQESVADAELVQICATVTREGGEVATSMEPEMKRKREAMKRVLEQADQLRLRTLKGVVEILCPMQAVHFLIAAAELHLRLHDFGKAKDAGRNDVQRTAMDANV